MSKMEEDNGKTTERQSTQIPLASGKKKCSKSSKVKKEKDKQIEQK